MGTLQVQETNLLRYDVQVGDNKSFIFGPRVVAALRFCQLYFSILCVRDRFSALAGCELLKGAEPFVLPACHTTLRSWVCMRGLLPVWGERDGRPKHSAARTYVEN